jgi:cobalamin-dependent methionine synthase I
MLAAAAAATAGWQVVYLGPDLPSGSIAKAVVETGAAAMALSITYPPSDPGLLVELREVRRLLPNGFPVIVGGRAAASYQDVLEEIEAVRLPNEPSVRSALDWVRLSREVREPSQASD